MDAIAKFEIEGSFKITGRGLVIYGNILEGIIKQDNFIVFNSEKAQIKLKIKSVDFLDNITDRIFKIGLTFYYEKDTDMEQLQILQISKQTAAITNI